MSARTSPLYATHETMDASFTDFGGWSMPVEFESIREEHQAVRSSLGRFDVSHMGELEISGPDAEALVGRLTTNDVSTLEPGAAQYSTITNEDGVILDDTVVYRLPEDPPVGAPGAEATYLVVPNAGHDAEMHEWWTAHRESWGLDADVENATDRYGMIAVQGPDAEDTFGSVMDSSLRDLDRFDATYVRIEETPHLVSRTGYTGEDGFEILSPWDATDDVWEAFDCPACGLGARDTLRLEMGFHLSGQDFHPEENPRTPIEAGLDWVVDLETDFVGREALIAQHERGVEETFVGFTLTERGVPRHGYPITDGNGDEIGMVTSGTLSPTLGEPIGLGYVDVDFASEGTEIRVTIRDEPKKAIINTPPFLGGYP